MSKLKNIIKQLTDKDSQEIYNSLINSNAEKSAYLLKFMREKHLSDSKIMEELEVNPNAFYTLRSRLNQKIEEFLLQQIESPRTDILKKVASIQEIFFTKKKAIIIASLKKLEKELISYDLSSELTTVYKYLKRLHINSPEQFHYSQLYNKHIAYMLALDKAEDLLATYFRKYEELFLQGKDINSIELTLLRNEINNVCNLYQSHRLYVYQSAVNIFHRLFVESENDSKEEESTEEIFEKVNGIIETYGQDTSYYHLRTVFEFLKYEYYEHNHRHETAEKHYDEVNDYACVLLTNYGYYTFSPCFLFSKIERSQRLNELEELYEENKVLFVDYENDSNDVGGSLVYMTYRAVVCFFVEKYDESAKWLNNLLNELSLKKYPEAHLEVKLLLALQYCLMRDEELYDQLISSIQRQVRILGKDECEHITIFIKIMKISFKDTGKIRHTKISQYVGLLKTKKINGFSVVKLMKLDETFVNQLCVGH
jgi:hypothetical protein